MVANTANLALLSTAEIDAALPVPEPTLTTNFNVSPYYDDYDKTKDFYRILFKPGYAVQARELTQIQTLTQNQIDRFGKHVFREGSIVLPGEFIIENDVDYVKVRDVDNSNNSVTISDYLDQTLVSSNTGIQAYVINVEDGTEASSNTKTAYLRYLNSSNTNTSIKTFQTNDVLTCNNGTLIVYNTANNVGKGSRFVIREGVYFAKSHFIRFPTQSVILNRYSTSPTCRVGFKVLESIVNASQDASLLDPALESSNYSAPGADRLKLSSILTVRDYNDTEGAPDFVELFQIKDGIVTEIYNRSQYNVLGDELATRTLDESGDYYVRGLTIRIRENLDVANNGGFSANGSANVLSIGIEPGKAYVKGYPVEILTTDYVTTDKALTYSNVSSQSISAGMGNFIRANNFTGSINQDFGTSVFLKDVANKRLTNGLWASGAALGNTIGTAKVRSIEYDSGTLGTPDGVVAMYLTDIRMNGTNAFSATKSIYASNFGGDAVLEDGAAVLKDINTDILIYSVGAKGIRTVKDTAGNSQMDYNFKRTSSVTVTGGTLSLTITSITGEELPYGTTTLSTADKREIILNVDSDVSIPTTAGVVSRDSDTTLTGNATSSFTKLNVGDKIQFNNNTTVYFINTITDATHITVDKTLPAVLSGNGITKLYKNGDIIDLTTKGFTSGTERTVSATSTTLTINLNESALTTTGKISYPINRSGAIQVNKILKANAQVMINTSNNIATTTGPYALGFADVLRINSIRNAVTGADLSGSFTFDNGQRDAFYDHARITPTTTLASNTKILVSLDYFEPSFTTGRGFFTVDSYPIDDSAGYDPATEIKTEQIPVYKSPRTGAYYDLRNSLDFRPVKAASISYTTSSASAPNNPSTDTAFSSDVNGLRLPVASSQLTYDYSFYLPRRDIVVIDKNKKISVIKGTPSISPVTPSVPEETMLLAGILVTQYPSLALDYAQSIGRADLGCVSKKLSNIRFTMRDIGVLKNRIENIEYYTSLNLLQKSALDMNILDADGVNRFKNGIFVDTFADHTFGQVDSPDYRIIVDTSEKSIRPMYTAHSFNYNYLPSDGETTNVQKTGNLVTLPYTEELLLEQAAVTSYRNVELSSYRFVGTLTLDPDIDTWIDTNSLPPEEIHLGATADQLPISTTTYDIERRNNGYLVGPRVGGPGGNGKVSRNYGQGGTGTAKPIDFFGRTDYYIQASNSPNDQPVYAIQDVTTTKTTTNFAYTEEVVTEGSKIVDIGLVNYIRPQTIDVWGRGLKRSTRVYVFFDGENMTNYCAQLTAAQYAQTPDQRRAAGFIPTYGNELVVDADGNLYVALELPTNKQFRVGQKEVVITDSPTNSIDASTYSKGYFVASGLTKTIQGKVITTGTITSTVDVDVTRRNENVFLGYLDNASCSAYSLFVKAPPEDEGLFLTSVDLYFARKHPTLGVWFELRAMDSAGGITRTQVPYSEVWLTADQITVSTDGYTNPTKVTFPCPVFLNNNTQYAFIIHTEGLNPDTYFWIARLGETDVRPESEGGGRKYNSRPLTGTFYTTNNNLNWNMVDDIDLKIKFYRANFSTGVQGVAVFGNEPVEKLRLANSSSEFVSHTEPITSNYKLTLSGNTSSYKAGDFLVGQTSGANSTIIKISGSNFYVGNTKYVSGERVTHRYNANATLSGFTSAMSALAYGSGNMYEYKTWRGNTTMIMKSSNGGFETNVSIRGGYSNVTSDILAIDNFRYSKVSFEPTYLRFSRNQLTFVMKTTSNTGSVGSYESVYESDGYFFSEEKALFSRSNEIASLSGANSNKVKFTMSSTSAFTSPVIDTTKTRSVYVDNIINANTTYGLEASSSGGELLNKYISRIVTLADGQDAEDLVVYLSAYRPTSTDVLVWCKILNAEDSDLIDNRNWIPMELSSGSTIYSSLADADDFKELKYVIPSSYMTGPVSNNSPGGEVQYTNSQGTTFTGFKYFAIKVGLSATNSAIVPRVTDLRAIAIQI